MGVRRLLLALALGVTLASCSTAIEEPAEELDPMHYHPGLTARVWFLQPIITFPTGNEFASGLNLEIAFFNVNPFSRIASGSNLGPELTTANGSIKEKQLKYTVNWSAKKTDSNRYATDYIRVEVRLAGAPSGPACNGGPGGNCLGYLNVRLVNNMGHGAYGTPHGFLPIVRSRTVPIAFKVVAEDVDDEDVPATIAELTPVTSGNFDETAGNCAASGFNLPGQGLQAVGAGLQAVGAGLQAVGAVGGLFAGPAADLEVEPITTAAVAAQLFAQLKERKGGHLDLKENVALLVVDDFNGIYNLPFELFQTGVDVEQLVADGKISHGALVLHHIIQLAKSVMPNAHFSIGLNTKTGAPYFKLASYQGPKLVIQPVDSGGLDTQNIVDELRQAVDYVGGRGKLGIRNLVVNMSFTVVPCAVVGDYGTSGIATFEQYLERLRAVNRIAPAQLGDLAELVSTPVDLNADPLLSYLNCPFPGVVNNVPNCNGRTNHGSTVATGITHVASSGNFGNSFALYPAAWPTVISVGSLGAPAGPFQKSPFSNAAEVLAPGWLFKLGQPDSRVIAYAGTSFSAPVVSLFSAIDQMKRKSECSPGQVAGSSLAPDLAYGQLNDLPLIGAFAQAGSASAVATYCN